MYKIEKLKKRIGKGMNRGKTGTITELQKQSFYNDLYYTIYKLTFVDKYKKIKIKILSINYDPEEYLLIEDVKVLELNILFINSKISIKADEKKSKIFFKSLYCDTDIDIVIEKISS